eukprot:5194480-Prymnesium_polylepis.2
MYWQVPSCIASNSHVATATPRSNLLSLACIQSKAVQLRAAACGAVRRCHRLVSRALEDLPRPVAATEWVQLRLIRVVAVLRFR